jgi:hypothetical protein
MNKQTSGAKRNSQSIGDEKWLDKLIAGSIYTSEPRFDAEKWKQEHPTEFQTLVDRRLQRPSTGLPEFSAKVRCRWRICLRI